MSEESSCSEETSGVVDGQDADDVSDGASGGPRTPINESNNSLRSRRRSNTRLTRGTGRPELVHSRLEGSRRSARECRVRRNIRYQYVADMVTSRERAIISLRQELEAYRKFCEQIDAGNVPRALINRLQTDAD